MSFTPAILVGRPHRGGNVPLITLEDPTPGAKARGLHGAGPEGS